MFSNLNINSFPKAGFYARLIYFIFSFIVCSPQIGYTQALSNQEKKVEKFRLTVENGKLNPLTTEIIADDRLSKAKGFTLKADVPEALKNERTEPDLVFDIQAAVAGKYEMRTHAKTNLEGVKLLKNARSKYESLFIKIQFDEAKPTKRVVYVPWDVALQTSGKFELSGKAQKLKIWLPKGINFDYVEFNTYVPPAVPEKAQAYVPKIVPPVTRPRLWVNQKSLPAVKANILAAENATAWAEVRKTALLPYVFKFDSTVEVQHQEALEIAAERKAFYYLITGDERVGREAIKLIDDYLQNVEFGNILDITRELGRAIYTGSEVYDWCYALLLPEQKNRIYKNLLRLADDMEIGWPPFLEPIVYGHGNEAQICRDLLAMSIAIYDENPLPYQYTSYAVLEQLVPMRKFQYQSGRHNQGVNYGAYRAGWDLHAATLFYKMTGQEVFDSNIKNLDSQWLYMRTPDGQMLRDGDGFNAPRNGKPYYWGPPLPLLLAYSYSENPVLKADFQQVGGLPTNPVLFLLLNNPNLKASANREHLPLTKDFGPVLGAMVARTGWDFGADSDDVVAEIKGGGYQFANHQHSDAGAIQLYYRGFQFGDIGQYKFYGTPYDMNFNKRSIAHSMMLVVDPEEKFGKQPANDGGTKSVRVNPESVAQLLSDSLFYNGKVISSDFGPSKLKPLYSYFSVDLKGAYSPKIERYNRRFCFINMDRNDIPAIIILSDDITSADADFKKYWQINSLNKPEIQDGKVILHSKNGLKIGKTYIDMLYPTKEERVINVVSGTEAVSVFGINFKSPDENTPEAKASRTMISPIKSNKADRFLTVMQVLNGDTKPLTVQHQNYEHHDVILFDHKLISMPKGDSLGDQKFEITVPKDSKNYQVILNGLAAGNWMVKGPNAKSSFSLKVEAGKNTTFFSAKGGVYNVVFRGH